MLHGNVLMVLLRKLKGLLGVLKTLSGFLMPGQVIFLSVAFGGGAMRLGGNFAAFGGYLLRFMHDHDSARGEPSERREECRPCYGPRVQKLHRASTGAVAL